MKTYGQRQDGTPLKSQWETILYFLQSTPGAKITQWQAIQEFGFTRLSALVKLIEQRKGITLQRRRIEVKTRYGGTTWVKEYWLDEEQR